MQEQESVRLAAFPASRDGRKRSNGPFSPMAAQRFFAFLVDIRNDMFAAWGRHGQGRRCEGLVGLVSDSGLGEARNR